MRRVIGAILCAAVLAAPTSIGAQGDRQSTREYPSYDQQTAGIVSRIANGDRASRLAKERPADPETIKLLMENRRIDEALAGVRLAATGPVPALVAVLSGIAEQLHYLSQDEPRGYVKTLAGTLDLIRPRLPQLPREDAARIARQLASLDSQMARGGSRGWTDRMKQVVVDYAGTETALLTEVDLIGEDAPGNIPAKIDGLMKFAEAHPASVAGSKALWQAGFQLHVNIPVTLVEKAGSDPTPRLLKVLAIYKDLQTGNYPPSEWVNKAPELVTGFFVSSIKPPVFAPGNLDVMIDSYRDFVFERFNGTDDTTIDDSIGYVLTSKLGDLFAIKGDRVGGIERTLADLESRAADPAAVQLYRAEFYLRQSTAGAADAQAAMAGKARETLTAVAAANSGYASRKALAILATMALSTGDLARARPLYEQYLRAFPRTPWSWLAALRIGLTFESEGKWREAATAYAKAGVDYRDEPLAGVLAAAYVARAQEALGEFEAALSSYRRALDAWRPEFGATISPTPWRQRGPARVGASPPVDATSVVRDQLSARAVNLERAAGVVGGMIVERGRWQISQQAWRDAQTTLRGFLKSYPASTLAGEARRLLHRAQLEQALDAAATDATAAGETTAIGQFDALLAEAADFSTVAAQLAKGAIRLRQANQAEAATVTRAALTSLLVVQAPLVDAPLRDPVDADVAELRRIVFRPMGDFPLLAGGQWNAFTFPTTPPEFFVMQPDIVVRLAGQEPATRVVYQRLPDLKNVLFISADEQAVLARMVAAIGGNQRRAPTQIMETPNQPVGLSRDIVTFWNGFFPTRPGHWGGWELETYPQITRIEFLDAGRTKASVMVTVGYSGATVVMEKVNGVWKAIRLTGQWIT